MGRGTAWVFQPDRSMNYLPSAALWPASPGMQVVKPEILLLHKAVYRPRPKDKHDFQRMLPHLRSQQRVWLREQITRIHPEHPWVNQLM